MRSRWSLLIYALIAIVIVLTLGRWGVADRPWHNCQESLIQQMFSDDCTPRRGGIRLPPANEAPSIPPQTLDPYS